MPRVKSLLDFQIPPAAPDQTRAAAGETPFASLVKHADDGARYNTLWSGRATGPGGHDNSLPPGPIAGSVSVCRRSSDGELAPPPLPSDPTGQQTAGLSVSENLRQEVLDDSGNGFRCWIHDSASGRADRGLGFFNPVRQRR